MDGNFDQDNSTRLRVDRESLGFSKPSGEQVVADLAFVMVHGMSGEDGLLQAHLDLCGIPTPLLARVMATTFHKGWTTALLRDSGIPVARSWNVHPPKHGINKGLMRWWPTWDSRALSTK